MAQFGRNFYGTSMYGVTSAFSGRYTSDIFSTGKTLTGTSDVEMKTVLPSVTYAVDDTSIIYDTDWTDGATSTYDKDANIIVTCRNLTISYTADAGNDTATITIKKVVSGTVTATTAVDVDMTTGTSYDASAATTDYAHYQINITKKTNDTKPINITGYSCVATDVSIETRASYDDPETEADETGTGWGDWTVLTPTYSNTSGNNWTITSTTPDYNGKNRAQFRLTLSTSDDTTTPEVESVKLSSGNTLNHVPRGTWVGTYTLGTTFKEYVSITWTSTEPSGTKVYIQTQSSNNGTDYTMLSAPYVKDDTSQIRLKAGQTSGTITSDTISPENLTKWLTFKTIDWSGTHNNVLFGPSTDEMQVRYEILREVNSVWENYYGDYKYTGSTTEAPLTIYDSSTSPMQGPIRIKATLYRASSTHSTPYVSSATFKCLSTYTETKNITGTTCLTDSSNTGKKSLTDIPTLAFTIPTVLGNMVTAGTAQAPEYTIINNTGKAFIRLYWQSQATTDPKTNKTTTQNDTLWVACDEATDNPRCYQWNAGTTVYPTTKHIPMYTLFSPSLSTGEAYQYFLEMGWDNDGVVDSESNRNASGRVIDIWWKSLGNTEDPPSGDPDTWTMVTTNAKDQIYAKVYAPGAAEEVAWTSAEVTYTDGIVNANNIKSKYTQANIPLPTIDGGVSYNGDHPFVVEIIDKSVKCNGFIVSNSRITLDKDDANNDRFTVIFDDNMVAYRQPVVRGTTANGKDLLPHSDVQEIIGVFRDTTESIPYYIVDTDYTFDNVNNMIDWTPNGTVPPAHEPDADATYYVTYRYRGPKYATVVFKCDYSETVPSRDIWTSNELIKRSGTVKAGSIFADSSMPALNRTNWPSAYRWNAKTNVWDLVIDPTTFQYTVEDDNFLVKSYIEDSKVKAKLRERKPKDNWMPQIHNGYYYIGSKRYYFFADPQALTVTPAEVQTDTDGKYISITPAPSQRAPIVVKEGSTLWRKVAFSDPVTGGYRTYNTEEVICESRKIIVTFDDLDLDNYTTLVYNSMDEIVGSPLTISGKAITMTLDDAELTALKGTTLKVVYQPKKAFTVDRNGPTRDTAIIRLSETPTDNLTITYESGDDIYALASAFELNPLLNPNHDGFMYVTSDPGTLSYYRINVNPYNLLCNGIDMAIVTVETTDKFGNPTSNVDLTVTSEMTGALEKYDPSNISTLDGSAYVGYDLSKAAGRIMYIYRAPYLTPTELAEPVEDTIHIIDATSGLGVDTKVRLLALADYGLGG